MNTVPFFFYLTEMNILCHLRTSVTHCDPSQHRFPLTLTLRTDKKAYFTSSGSSLSCLFFPIVLSPCHPAVKTFGGEEDECARIRSV